MKIEMLLPADVAREAHVMGIPITTTTVRRWCDSGLLPAVARTPNGGRLFEREAVTAFLKQRAQDRKAA